MTESFAELFEQSIASQRIRPGTILNGLIVEVGQDYVIVNVGLKSEAVIPSEQFKNEKGEIEVVVGETVEVALDSVEDGSGEIVVATTRPETMVGDTAVAVHPGDERYADLIGKQVRLPLVGRLIPIVADDYADPEKGTGAVKITPAHDFNDFATGKRHKLEEISIFDLDGTMNANAGPFRGLDRKRAQVGTLALARHQGEPHRHVLAQSATLAVAESCTGGLLGERITSVSGSSRYFAGGAIVYANAVKTELAGVPADMIERHGAVSREVAAALAEGIRYRCEATLGIGITGVAGPSGGTPEKPVGLVFHALASDSGTEVIERNFPGDRKRIRWFATTLALDMVRRKLM